MWMDQSLPNGLQVGGGGFAHGYTCIMPISTGLCYELYADIAKSRVNGSRLFTYWMQT